MKSMRLLEAAWIIVALSSTAHAAVMSRQVSWAELEKAGATLPAKVLPAGPSSEGKVLKIKNPQDQRKHATMPSGAWWDDRTGGWIGGVLGTVIGCAGGLIGLLAGGGRARGFVMMLTVAMVVGGLALLAVAAVAALLGQPYAVWYPLALAGLITTIVMGALRRTIRQRYEQAELQRMSAMDMGNRGV